MSITSIVGATVASRDVAAAVDFHRRAFDLEVVSAGSGETVLGAVGVPWGWLRLVPAAADPGHPPPLPWEIGGRVLGLKPRDAERSRQHLLSLGRTPTPIVSYEVAPGATTVEYWVAGTDDVTWELPLSGRVPSPALDANPDRGHGEVMAAAITVASIDEAVAMLEAGGMALLHDGVFEGEAFTTLFGMPAEAGVRAAILKGADGGGLILELWEFVGLAAIQGPERPVGISSLALEVEDLEGVEKRLARAGAKSAGAGRFVGPGGVTMEMRTR